MNPRILEIIKALSKDEVVILRQELLSGGATSGKHANTHAAGGVDEITLESLKAAAATHSHSLATLGAAAAEHTHTAESLGISPGTRWFPVTTTPNTNVGANGDFALNTDTFDLYEKRTGTWVNIGNIKGGGGGVGGTKWTMTSGEPTGGVDGDMHLNTSTGQVLERLAGMWLGKGSLKGPKGDTGATGSNGTNGAVGADGTKWHVIEGVPTGVSGRVNDLAVNKLTWDVYEKTGASAWTLVGNIKGDKGDAGSGGSGGAPATHAANHHKGGSDEITPSAIGAADENHTHTLSGLGIVVPALDAATQIGRMMRLYEIANSSYVAVNPGNVPSLTSIVTAPESDSALERAVQVKASGIAISAEFDKMLHHNYSISLRAKIDVNTSAFPVMKLQVYSYIGAAWTLMGTETITGDTFDNTSEFMLVYTDYHHRKGSKFKLVVEKTDSATTVVLDTITVVPQTVPIFLASPVAGAANA